MKQQVLAAAVVALCGMSAALAQQPTLYVGSYGGSTEKVFKEKIIPAFEARHKVKVVYVAGNSTDTLAKLQAQKARQELDVVLLDDGPMYQALQLGFCDAVKDAPVYKDLYPLAKLGDNKATGIGVVATGLVYNTEAFRKAGLPKPDSWELLADRKFRQKVAIPPISNTYGLQTLIMFAKLRKGGDQNIEPGFAALTREVGPNVLAWEPSPGKMAQMLQTGEAALAVWGNGRVQNVIDQGAPVEFVYPKEGAVALLSAGCVVEGAPQAKLAQQFLQYAVSPEAQADIAEGQGWGPVNKATKVSPEVAKRVVYGPEKVNALIAPDYDAINAKRAEWTNRWNRAVER